MRLIGTQAIITGTLPTYEGKYERPTITKYDNEFQRKRKNKNTVLCCQNRSFESQRVKHMQYIPETITDKEYWTAINAITGRIHEWTLQ